MKRLTLISAMVLAISIAAFILTKSKQAISTDTPSATIRTSNRVNIGGKNINELQSATEETAKYTPLLSEQLASKIQLSQLSGIRRSGTQDILVFNDGSELYVTDYVRKQLPGQIRYRLEYSVREGAPANYGN